MKNEFCTEKQSLALRELGYDEPCLGYYENGVFIFWYDSKQDNELLLNCTAPLRQQAFKFFRDKCNMFGHIGIHNDGIWSFSVGEYMPYKYIPTDFIEFNTYEEAEEACLDKLIEIVKHK